MKRIVLIGCMLSLTGFAAAQILEEDIVETIDEPVEAIGWLNEFDPYSENYESVPEYPKVRVPKQKAWDYPDLREADVAWMTRYERIIDTRQKMNMVLRYPKLSVFDVMLKLALS